MGLKIENVKQRTYTARELQNKEKSTPVEKKRKEISKQLLLMGTLAGLAILGGGVLIVKNVKIKARKRAYEDAVLKFRNWFEEIKSLQSYIWDGGTNKCIPNPDAAECLKKLDNLTPVEKKAFVDEYCRMTGFPDIKTVSENINNEIIGALNKISRDRKNKIVFAAYDSNCSVGRNAALPGSDCDGLFIAYEKISDAPEYSSVEVMAGDLMNQRIINSSGMHYPDALKLDDLMFWIAKVDNLFEKIATPEKIIEYKNNLQYDGKSYLKAAQFNIDLAPLLNDTEKNFVCRAGFFVENLRAGKVLVNHIPHHILTSIKGSALYIYSNMMRQEGLAGKVKPKIKNRAAFCERFSQAEDEEKFNICRNLLKHSLGLKTENYPNDPFEKFDMGDILEMYRKVSTFPAVGN